MTKEYLNPPTKTSFNELFLFVWDHGLGNDHSELGDATPWTDASLEEAFLDLGYGVDRRSIQNWRSGKTLPKRENLQALARIVSEDEMMRNRWIKALIAARQRSLELRNQVRTEYRSRPDNVSGIDFSVSESAPPTARKFPYLAFGVFIFVLLNTGVAAAFFAFDQNEVEVTDLLFCDEKRFSKTEKKCRANVQGFPSSTQKIYVSFATQNVENGHPFERRWYRNGEMFKQRDGFFDDAWEGYTWIRNPLTHDPGTYHLRIIVDGQTTTGSFVVEE